MARRAHPIKLSHEQKAVLESIVRSRTSRYGLALRSRIILKSARGLTNKAIGSELEISEDSVNLWRGRWKEGEQELGKLAGRPKKLRAEISRLLSDKARIGSPGKFEAEEVCRIIALACETPPEHLSHWTCRELVRETIKRGITSSISKSTMARHLNQADIKPHRTKYWLNHEVKDEGEFRKEVREVCKLYHQAGELHEQGKHLVSVDEKTGIQALERAHPTRPMEPGKVEAVEHEYERHGTQVLIANFEVATGKVISPTVGDTRTEEDFATHIQTLVETDPQGEWIIICDQLNTHKSETLVRTVANICGIDEELGEKGKSGILRNMASRAAFLREESHRIRFVFTPKHCSWLNQVEIWFGILSRRLLKRGNFSSTAELKARILKFIAFFNETLAKPFRWTYIGKPLLN